MVKKNNFQKEMFEETKDKQQINDIVIGIIDDINEKGNNEFINKNKTKLLNVFSELNESEKLLLINSLFYIQKILNYEEKRFSKRVEIIEYSQSRLESKNNRNCSSSSIISD